MNTPDQYRVIVEHAQRIAAEMPLPLVEMLARAIDKADNWSWESARIGVLHLVNQPLYRSLATALFDSWQANARDLSPQAVALALYTAAAAEKARREGQAVELVWTGPDTQAIPLRHTEQAILQVLDSAHHRITLVSYAVYRIQRIREALVRAAQRGVRIKVIVETPDRLEGENEYNTLLALGNDVAAYSAVYYWPKEQRGGMNTGS
jgi:phosphatidylserine/phosphatidylglycerophosphate/cardiolipin synthase-like enzyme